MTLKELVVDIQHDSYVLADLAKCLNLIIEEGDDFTGPKAALSGVVAEKTKNLSERLEEMEVQI